MSFSLKRHDNLHPLKNQLQSYKCLLKTLEKLNFKQLVARRDLSAQRSWDVIWNLKMHEIPDRVEGLQHRTNWLRVLLMESENSCSHTWDTCTWHHLGTKWVELTGQQGHLLEMSPEMKVHRVNQQSQ